MHCCAVCNYLICSTTSSLCISFHLLRSIFHFHLFLNEIHLTHFPGNGNEDKINTLSLVIILVVICKCVFIGFALMAVCYRLVEREWACAPRTHLLFYSLYIKYQKKKTNSEKTRNQQKDHKMNWALLPRQTINSNINSYIVCWRRRCSEFIFYLWMRGAQKTGSMKLEKIE